MRFGFVLPGGSPAEQVEYAALADESGWDGVFVCELSYGLDAWSLLSAMAMRTTRIGLGTMLTPMAWRRPWKLASQAATLDHLSDGRAILAVGLGAVDDALGRFGEVTDRAERAALVDEGLDVIDALWRGDPSHDGRHHHIDLSKADALGPRLRPVQQPRVPIWVVGAWNRPKSMQRVLRGDGILPMAFGDDGPRELTPRDVADIRAWLRDNGKDDSFDIVWEGETPADDVAAGAEAVRPWAEAGCTWWMETRWMTSADDRDQAVRERLAAGPPRP